MMGIMYTINRESLKRFDLVSKDYLLFEPKHVHTHYEGFMTHEKGIQAVNLRKLPLKKNYLLQQGIVLMRTEGRETDFRVYCQRNGQGEWVITASCAKIAGEGALTTHTFRGGTVEQVSDVLKQAFPRRYKKLEEQLYMTCIEIAQLIQTHYGDGIGEIGYDMAIDEGGNVWMLEANSRPGRTLFKQEGWQEANLTTMRTIFEYAEYLESQDGAVMV
jgi:hypothetical protein